MTTQLHQKEKEDQSSALFAYLENLLVMGEALVFLSWVDKREREIQSQHVMCGTGVRFRKVMGVKRTSLEMEP